MENELNLTINFKINQAISDTMKFIKSFQEKHKIPGMAVGVSIGEKVLWLKGFGYSDVERKIPCTPDTVMKIASISKSISSVLLVKEVELGHLQLDTDIRTYMQGLPVFNWQGEEVEISCRQLSCHKAGIRGYKPASNEFGYEEYAIRDHFSDVNSALTLFINDPLLSKPGTAFNYSNHGYTLLSRVIETTSKQTYQQLLHTLFKTLKLKSTFVESSQSLTTNTTSYYSLKGDEITKCPPLNSSYKVAAAGLISTVTDLLTFANALLVCCKSTNKNGLFSKHKNINNKSCNNHKDGINCKKEKNVNFETNKPTEKPYLSSALLEELWRGEKGTKVSWCESGVYGLGWQIIEDEYAMHKGHTGRTVGASSVLVISTPKDTINEKVEIKSETEGICGNKERKELGNENDINKRENKFDQITQNKSFNTNTTGPKQTASLNTPTRAKDKKAVVVTILCNLGGVPMGELAIYISNLFINCFV